MKVAVIGAGAMGSGIAQTFAQCDAVEKVYLCDIKQEFADGGFAKIKKGLDKLVGKGKMEQAAADAITGKIVTGLSDIAVDADLVVEAALERMDVKQDCFKKLQDEIVQNPDCIYASNTSSLSITQIGAGLSKPIIGMHFFNPAPVMKLVEVIAGINTPAETVEKVIEISKQLGKVPVQVNEAAGFAVNRILVPMINEGLQVSIDEGCAIEEELFGSCFESPAGTRRFHRTGYLPCYHGCSLRRDSRQQVCCKPSASQDGPRQETRRQDRHRFL